MNNTEYDKINNGVAFRDSDHCYFKIDDPTQRFISVTTLIHSFTQPMDQEFWSKYKALERLLDKEQWQLEKKGLLATKRWNDKLLDVYGISVNDFNREQQAVLDEWAEKNRQACERGTKIHLDMENSFYAGGKNVNLKKFGIGGKFECRKDYTDLDLEYGVYPEYLIHMETQDGILKLAGQIDLLIKDGNNIIIGDFKTNQKIDKTSFFDQSLKSNIKMQYPLNNLQDCNLMHYSMQLSTYAWMLQRINPNFVIKDLFLYHFGHDGSETMYHVNYLKTEVERMLCYYKKQLVKEQQKLRRSSIDY